MLGEEETALRSSLRVERLELDLETTSPGQLLPWIGPALRGNVGDRLRESCRCDDGRHLSNCPYGLLYDPSPAPGVPAGKVRPIRPLSLAPAFPLGSAPLRKGSRIRLAVTTFGASSERGTEIVAEALDQAGRVRGLGPDQVQYKVDPNSIRLQSSLLQASDLPDHPDEISGVVPRLRIQLHAPLFLTTRSDSGRRVQQTDPALSDLLRASLRVLGAAFRMHAEPLPSDFHALRTAADPVHRIPSQWQPFEQARWSSRTHHRHRMRGVQGSAVFSNVPWSLIPWLTWGGRLHAGTHRVAGAGAWTVTLG